MFPVIVGIFFFGKNPRLEFRKAKNSSLWKTTISPLHVSRIVNWTGYRGMNYSV